MLARMGMPMPPPMLVKPGDEGVQAGAAQLFHERQRGLVQVREARVVHDVVVDLGARQRQDHHHHAADEHGDPQGRVGHHPLAPALRQPVLCPAYSLPSPEFLGLPSCAAQHAYGRNYH